MDVLGRGVRVGGCRLFGSQDVLASEPQCVLGEVLCIVCGVRIGTHDVDHGG